MKYFYWMLTALQGLLLISAYSLQYFSVKKMGMMRYLVYKNQLWQSLYPISQIRLWSVVIILLCTLACLAFFYKIHISIRGAALPMVTAAIFTGLFVIFTLTSSPAGYRAYYLICPLLAGAALIQDLKLILSMKLKKSES